MKASFHVTPLSLQLKTPLGRGHNVYDLDSGVKFFS